MNKETLTKYISEHCEYVFTPEEESTHFVGNCLAIDEETDKAQEHWIAEQLAYGNDAAWFCARVDCKFRHWTGTDYLGGCSYKNFEDFTEREGNYYTDMKAQALEDCVNQILADKRHLEILEQELTA